MVPTPLYIVIVHNVCVSRHSRMLLLLCYFQFNRSSGKENLEESMWMAYCCFHNADYKKARKVSSNIYYYRHILTNLISTSPSIK